MNGRLSFLTRKLLVDNQLLNLEWLNGLKNIKLSLLFGILLISSFGFGQIGPYGVDSSHLRLWLDASDLDGDGIVEGYGEDNTTSLNSADSTVTQWNDKSSYGDHFTVPGTPGSATAPFYVDSVLGFNNKAVVDFDSTDILFNTIAPNWSGEHTIFIVFQQQTSMSPGTSIFASGYTNGNIDERFQIGVDTTGTNFAYRTSSGSGTIIDQTILGSQATALTQPTLYTATRNPSNFITGYNNGSQSNTMTSTNGDDFDRYYLNSDRTLTLTNDCQIAEVIIYDTVLGPLEMARIHNYLSCKYGQTFDGASPGGIGPCNVSLWMKADEGVNLSGSDVTTWADQANFNFDGAAPPMQEPSFNPMDNNFNPSISFDTTMVGDAIDLGAAVTGPNDGMVMASSEFSIYTVAQSDTTTDGVLFADNDCLQASGYNVRFNSATTNWMFEGIQASGGALLNSGDVETEYARTEFSLLKLRKSVGDYEAETNEGDFNSGSSGAPINFTGPTQRYIGTSNGGCSGDNFKGKLSELIVVRSAISVNQDKQIQSYLGLKYGLSLDPSLGNYLASDGTTEMWDDAVGAGAYWNDVAGIGRDEGSTLDQRISKSQDPTGIVTISTTSDFSSANTDASRTSLADNSFLVWGNNNQSASNAWTDVDAPSDFVILQEIWSVQETGTVGGVSVRVEVNDPDNNMPTFNGELFFVHGNTISGAVPDTMTETFMNSGIWIIDGVDFADGDFFTFAVQNKVDVEFSADLASSSNEAIADNFPSILVNGVLNLDDSFLVYNSSGGSATDGGVDYDTYSDTTIDLSAGVYNVQSFALTPPILTNDGIPEPLETILFSINIASSDGVVIGDADGSNITFTGHTYTITDDDSYQISIQKVTDGTEGLSDVTFEVFVVGGVNPSATEIKGNITWSGSADGLDFDNVTVDSFTLAPMVASFPINLSTSSFNDDLLEGTETIIGTIDGLSAGSVPVNDTDTAYLADDEMTNILIEIDTVSNFGSTTESGVFRYIISLENDVQNNSGTAIEGSITFTGTATPSNDFTNITNFIIPFGAYSQTIEYTANPDFDVELTESVTAQVSVTSGPGTTSNPTDTATAFIYDQDTTNLTASLTIPGGTQGVTEGAGVNIVYNITLDGGKTNETGFPITGDIDFTGTADLTDDYTLPMGGTFSIPDGVGVGVYTVDVTNDGVPEANDTIIATISNLSLGNPNPGSNGVSYLIFDDDGAGLQLAIGSPTDTVETTPEGFVSFVVSVVSGGPSASPITGSITYPGSTAGAGDFVPDYDFLIPAFDSVDTIILQVTDDLLAEPTETVVAQLTGSPMIGGTPSGSYTNTIATAYIHDNDAANLSISIDTVAGFGTGVEGISDVTFVVYLEGAGVSNTTGSEIFGSLSYGGTANSGDDYTAGPISFAIPVNAVADTIVLDVLDDIFVEYTENIALSIVGQPTVGSVNNSIATGHIIDIDLDSLSLSISNPQDGMEVAGNGDSLFFVVSIDDGLLNGLGEDLTGLVTYTGNADPGIDFADVANFAIPPGSSFTDLEIQIVDDQNLELDETVIATITEQLIPGSINLAANTDTAIIVDNDLIGAQLEITTAVHGTEGPISDVVNPEFIIGVVGGGENQTGSAITGTLTWSGTADLGIDYIDPLPALFTIPNDSSLAVITVPLIDDLVEEQSDTIIASISAPNLGLTLSADSSAKAGITDDDLDTDADGLPDINDPNPINIDSDCDGIFDGCDADADGDGMLDVGAVDTDGDGINDGCDADVDGDGNIDNGPDINNDGLNDVEWDPTDDDGDLLPNHVDPDDTNPDIDDDGIPDGADADVDNDGVLDNGCDGDGDGIHDVADSDDNPSDGNTDAGNADDDGDGIDNDWDSNDRGERLVNYIVSPNGDGINETLQITGIEFFENHELVIFNRWGSPVYKSNEYSNDWDGQILIDNGITMGAEKLSDGTYFYTLDLGDGGELIRGYIEIRK